MLVYVFYSLSENEIKKITVLNAYCPEERSQYYTLEHVVSSLNYSNTASKKNYLHFLDQMQSWWIKKRENTAVRIIKTWCYGRTLCRLHGKMKALYKVEIKPSESIIC